MNLSTEEKRTTSLDFFSTIKIFSNIEEETAKNIRIAISKTYSLNCIKNCIPVKELLNKNNIIENNIDIANN